MDVHRDGPRDTVRSGLQADVGTACIHSNINPRFAFLSKTKKTTGFEILLNGTSLHISGQATKMRMAHTKGHTAASSPPGSPEDFHEMMMMAKMSIESHEMTVTSQLRKPPGPGGRRMTTVDI
jgi:hypothetical protein